MTGGVKSAEVPQRGLWIGLFGPDGVGKSAVIERLQGRLGPAFSGYRRFHFRPHFGRPNRNRQPVTKPHAQIPRGVVASFCKLVYCLADCWIGYVMLVAPSVRRGRLVIFDRYLPDILVDPVRYRLPAKVMRIAAALVRLAPRPDLCILLDAPAEVVQRRKQEVSVAVSERQREAYRQMFSTLKPTVVINADAPVDEVTLRVATTIRNLSSTPEYAIPLACESTCD